MSIRGWLDQRSEQIRLALEIIEEARNEGYQFHHRDVQKEDIDKALEWLKERRLVTAALQAGIPPQEQSAAPQWTQELPTEPGFYVYMAFPGCRPMVVEVYAQASGRLFVIGDGTIQEALEDLAIQPRFWLGPIPIPAPPEVK